MQNFGKIIFKIDQVLEEKNISKNKLEKEANAIDAKIHHLTEESLKEGFYDDQEKVIETFANIKNLEDKKQRYQDKWLELSLELEEN